MDAGSPQFALQDARRCGVLWIKEHSAICGLVMAPAEAGYRLFSADETPKALRDDACIRFDGPGRRECMLFSAAVCPFFVSAGSCRSVDHLDVPEGTCRGTRAALLGFRTVVLGIQQDPPRRAVFNYRGDVEHVSFTLGQEPVPHLQASEPPAGPVAVRIDYKTEPQIKKAWTAAQRKARRQAMARPAF
ncbi:hypothetical protein ACWCOW_40290 [Streptomyces sp. NPDC001939]